MSTNIAATSGAAETNPEHAEQAQPQSENKPVTMSDLLQFAETLTNRFEKRLRKVSETRPEPKPVDGETVEQQVARLRSEIDSEREQNARERKEIAIQSAIRSLGTDPAYDEVLANHIAAKHGPRIKVEGREVFALGDLEARVPLADFVRQAVGPLAEKFKPAVPVPTGGKRTSTSAAGDGAHPFSKLTRAEIMTEAKRDPTAFRTFVTDHAEEWSRKKAST